MVVAVAEMGMGSGVPAEEVEDGMVVSGDPVAVEEEADSDDREMAAAEGDTRVFG